MKRGKKCLFDLGGGQYILVPPPPTLTVNWHSYNTHEKSVLFQVDGEVTLSALRLPLAVLFMRNGGRGCDEACSLHAPRIQVPFGTENVSFKIGLQSETKRQVSLCLHEYIQD